MTFRGADLDAILCFSHLRWDFVFQRPQQVLSRAARQHRVFYIEEPRQLDVQEAALKVRLSDEGVHVVSPHLPLAQHEGFAARSVRSLVDELVGRYNIRDHVQWYYTPMALPASRHLNRACVVYDCMDELALFKNAPAELSALESELFRHASVVFTGGHSLFEHKRLRHHNVHVFPSAVDAAHFAHTTASEDPADQRSLRRPRIGFYGVLDERFDPQLLAGAAQMRPDWQFILIGPVVKIEPSGLPRAANIHYLGQRPYASLPAYLHHWDIAFLPFARNEATRFISPTKTLEYLAAGKPVISTSVQDVVEPYGQRGWVAIADDAASFIRAADTILAGRSPKGRPGDIERFIADMSWDSTWSRMQDLITSARGHARCAPRRHDVSVAV
ncbi:MAG: glycosyltransferase family 1 protein [Candidatus Eremiobacteraeota bacterium]|nr:glycosyltransferase family 1 protein [Candidatus Eremiobacteraeota bacterium]